MFRPRLPCPARNHLPRSFPPGQARANPLPLASTRPAELHLRVEIQSPLNRLVSKVNTPKALDLSSQGTVRSHPARPRNPLQLGNVPLKLWCSELDTVTSRDLHTPLLQPGIAFAFLAAASHSRLKVRLSSSCTPLPRHLTPLRGCAPCFSSPSAEPHAHPSEVHTVCMCPLPPCQGRPGSCSCGCSSQLGAPCKCDEQPFPSPPSCRSFISRH